MIVEFVAVFEDSEDVVEGASDAKAPLAVVVEGSNDAESAGAGDVESTEADSLEISCLSIGLGLYAFESVF